MGNTICAEVRERLFALQDEAYGDFTAKLLPNIQRERVIGVRFPAMRALAKEFSRRGDISGFLSDLPHHYLEENSFHALLLGREKDLSALIAELDRFLPFVDNWATCDTLRPAAIARRFPEALPDIRRWIASGDTYTVRFGIGMLMANGLHEHFQPEFNRLVADIRSEEYYINMMRAWYFATALAFRPDETMPFITEGKLDAWTHNKAIQKAIESCRVTPELKERLRALRRKQEKNGSKREPLRVVAAVLRREGRVLICRRPDNKARGGQWEFPGGKIEPGETPEEALVRECREELGFTLRPLRPFTEVLHEYPDITVLLLVYGCEIAEGEPTALEHSEIRFVSPDELGSFDLCPADRTIAERLQNACAKQS